MRLSSRGTSSAPTSANKIVLSHSDENMIDRSNSGLNFDHGDEDVAEELDKAFADYLRQRDSGPVDVSRFLDQYPKLRQELEALISDEDGILNAADRLNATVLNQPKTVSLDPTTALPQPVPDRLGDYTLIREIGRGGMGVVFEARQAGMRRHVAVKILPPQHILDRKRLGRFQNEIRAVGQLDHPGIVPVYASSVASGVHYYAMKYVDGVNLSEVIQRIKEPAAETTRLHSDPTAPTTLSQGPSSASVASSSSPSRTVISINSLVDAGRSSRSSDRAKYFRSVASIIADAADALHHAHEMGVVHRDIKPANLMLEHGGGVWVTDFGLAQIRSTDGETQSGTLLGTLRYMSPEQAYARRVTIDHRTDVYSLGITLFELLTLEHAFQADSQPTLLRMVAFEEPNRPRVIRPTIPVDLETITLKAISKKPDDRYDSTQAFAADLRRYLQQEPIHARPITPLQRLGKWAKRNRSTVGFIAALVFLTCAFGITLGYEKLNQARNKAANAETQVKLEKDRADAEEKRRLDIERLLRIADSQRLAAQSALAGKSNPGLAVRLAAAADRIHSSPESRAAAYAATMQSHELLRVQASRNIAAAELSPDGKLILATAGPPGFASEPSSALLLNAKDGDVIREIKANGTPTSAVFSPRGGRILSVAAPRSDEIAKHIPGGRPSLPPQLFETSSGELLQEFEDCSCSSVSLTNFSPSGQRVVLPSGETARVFDAVEGTEQFQLKGHKSPITQAAFDPTGKRVAAAAMDGSVIVWSAADGEVQHELQPPARAAGSEPSPTELRFSASGRLLLAYSRTDGIRVFSLANGQKLDVGFVDADRGEIISDTAFLANGIELTSHSFDGKVLRTLRGELAAISPDRSLVATTEWDDRRRQIFVSNTFTGQQLAVLAGHDKRVLSVQFSRNGRYLISVSTGNVIRLWDVRAGRTRMQYGQYRRDPRFRFDVSDKNLLVSSTSVYMTSRFDTQTGKWTKPRRGLQFADAWHGTDRLVTTDSSAVVIRDGEVLSKLALTERVSDALLHSTSQTAVFVGHEGGAWLWNYKDNQSYWFDADGRTINAARFHPDGDRLCIAGDDGLVRLLDTSANLLSELRHDRSVEEVRFSSNGRLLATCQDDGLVSVWDMTTKTRLIKIDNAGAVLRIRFTNDDKGLIAYKLGSTSVSIWDVATGDKLASNDEFGPLKSIAKHPRDPVLLSAGLSGVKLWNYQTGELQTRSEIPACRAAFVNDAKDIVLATFDELEEPIRLPPKEAASIPAPKLYLGPADAGGPGDVLAGLHGAIVALHADGAEIVKCEKRFGYQLYDQTTRELITEQYEHLAPICVAKQFGHRVVTVSWDGTTVVSDTMAEKTIRRIRVKTPIVGADATDKLVAVGETSGLVSVFDIDTGNLVHSNQHDDCISHVTFRPDSQQLLSADLGGELKALDLATGITTSFEVGQAVADLQYSPSSRTIAVLEWGRVTRKMTSVGREGIAANTDQTANVLLLQADTLTLAKSLEHTERPRVVSWSPSGDHLMTMRASEIRLWSADGQPEGQQEFSQIVHAEWVSDKTLLLQARSGITLWDLKTQKPIQTFEGKFDGDLADAILGRVQPLRVANSESMFVSYGQTIYKLDIFPLDSLNQSQSTLSDSEKARFQLE